MKQRIVYFLVLFLLRNVASAQQPDTLLIFLLGGIDHSEPHAKICSDLRQDKRVVEIIPSDTSSKYWRKSRRFSGKLKDKRLAVGDPDSVLVTVGVMESSFKKDELSFIVYFYFFSETDKFQKTSEFILALIKSRKDLTFAVEETTDGGSPGLYYEISDAKGKYLVVDTHTYLGTNTQVIVIEHVKNYH